MLSRMKELFRTRDLLWAWTSRNIRARYQQSILGGLWAVVQPVATVAVFTIIFTKFIPVDTGGLPYPIFAYVAMVPWRLFASSLTDMTGAVVANMGLVSKIYFPREILPLAAMLARLLDFVIAYAVMIVMMLYYQLPLYPAGLLFVPLILIVQLALALGLGLIGTAVNVFYRDVSHLLVFGIQLWFYATPIVYPVTVVPKGLQPFYFLNPMTGVTEAYRAVLLHQQNPGPSLWTSALFALAVLLAGYWFFKRVEYQFADIV
jgi:lipopolysaccharide transport system permease protein